MAQYSLTAILFLLSALLVCAALYKISLKEEKIVIKIFFQSCALSLIFITSAPAKELTNMNSNTAFPVPYGFVIKSHQEVKADREDVILKRYDRSDNRNTRLGGEYFSTLHTPERKLKGRRTTYCF